MKTGIIHNDIKDFLILSSGKAIQILVSLVGLRLITELLSEGQVGIYYILLAVISLLAFSFFNPLGQFYGRNLIRWQHAKALRTATNVMLVLRVMSIPFALAFAMLIYYIFDYKKYFPTWEYVTFIFVALIALTHGVLLNAINVLISRKLFTAYAVSTLVTGLTVSILLVELNQTAMSWIYGLTLMQILFSFFLYKAIVKGCTFSVNHLRLAFRPDHVKRVLFFILPVTITLFLQWGQHTSFRLIIEGLYSVEALAFIAVGMALSGAIFSSLESLAMQFYMPVYLKQITNASKVRRACAWNQLAGILLPIYMVAAMYTIACAPYLAKLLVADKFYDAYTFTMIGAAIELFRVITNLVYIVSQSEIKTKNTITPYLFGLTLMVLSLYGVDLTSKLWVAPVILALSNLVALFFMAINMKKILDVKFDYYSALKATTFMSPLLAVHFLEFNNTALKSIILLLCGAAYLICILYFLLKDKLSYKEG